MQQILDNLKWFFHTTWKKIHIKSTEDFRLVYILTNQEAVYYSESERQNSKLCRSVGEHSQIFLAFVRYTCFISMYRKANDKRISWKIKIHIMLWANQETFLFEPFSITSVDNFLISVIIILHLFFFPTNWGMDFHTIWMAYFFHELMQHACSSCPFRNICSHKLHIWMAYFLHE